jgi:hypothetical protein
MLLQRCGVGGVLAIYCSYQLLLNIWWDDHPLLLLLVVVWMLLRSLPAAVAAGEVGRLLPLMKATAVHSRCCLQHLTATSAAAAEAV